MEDTLNKSCGWIVAFWLLLAVFSYPWWVAGLSIIGAMVTVLLWAVLTRYLGDLR